jgi:transposase
MMMLSAALRAYICAEPIDMRKSIDALAQLVGPLFNADAFSGQLYVFVGRRRDKVKLLLWDRSGFWLMYKRLERGRFPRPEELASRGLSIAELTAWLEGIDLARVARLKPVEATRVA